MATPISIPINLTPGNLQGIAAAQQAIAATQRQLNALQGWTVLPGGGIQRTTTATGVPPTPGVGAFVPPAMAPNAAFQGVTQQLPAATRVVQQHAAAVQQATTATQAFFTTHTQAQQRQTLQATQSRIQGLQQLLATGGGTPQLQARLAVLQAQMPLMQAAMGGGPPLWGGWTGMMGGVPPSPGVVGGPGGPGPWGGWTGMLGGPPGRPPRGRPPAPDDEDDESRMGVFLGRTWRGLQRRVAPIVGLVAGIGAYQTITEAMRLYEQRARGMIDVGMQLDVNFDAVGRGIDDLRQRYRFLAQDTLAAMQVTQRISGGRAGLAQAAPFAAAYGIPLPQAAEMQALAGRLTAGDNPLVTMLALAGRVGPGITPMGPGALTEEALSMAQIGAATGVQAPAAFYGRMAGLIGSMGDVYQTPGAQARVYGQLAQGLTQAPNEAVQAVRMQALGRLRDERVRAGLGTRMTIGQGAGAVDVDLSTLFGLETAMEAGGTQPDIIQAYERAARELTGGRPDLAGRAFYEIVGGGRLGRIQTEQLRRQGGRLATLGLPGGEATALGEAEVQARLAAREERPEFRFADVEARWEAALEGIGRPLTKVALDIRETIATTALNLQESGGGVVDVLKEIGAGFANLSGEGKVLVGTLVALSSSSTLGQILGALTALGGVNQSLATPEAGQLPYGIYGPAPQGIPGARPSWISPELWGMPSIQPQRPGP